MVLEIDLDDLVAQSEHDSVLSSHPLLHVHRARWWPVSQVFSVLFLRNLERCALLSSA